MFNQKFIGDSQKTFEFWKIHFEELKEKMTTLKSISTLAISKQGYCNRVLDFFTVNNFARRMIKIINDNFRFSSY